jgi:uncharacterized membrane protein YjdF
MILLCNSGPLMALAMVCLTAIVIAALFSIREWWH